MALLGGSDDELFAQLRCSISNKSDLNLALSNTNLRRFDFSVGLETFCPSTSLELQPKVCDSQNLQESIRFTLSNFSNIDNNVEDCEHLHSTQH